MKSQTLYSKVVLLKVLQLTHMPNIKQQQKKSRCEQVTTAVPMTAAAGLGTGLGVWPGGDMTTSFAAFCLLAPPAFSSFGFFIRDFFSPDSCVLKHHMSWRYAQTTHHNSSVKSSILCALNTVFAN